MDYEVIYADPPWSYRDKAAAGDRGACFKYPVLSFNDICELPVADVVARDAVLFLWITGPHIAEGLHVDLMKRWGFKPQTMAFTWVKRNKKAPSWFWGMGRWTRANAEFCLLGTRGKPKRLDAGVHSVVDAAIMEHSRKPAEVRDRIVKLVGDLPRLELFARGDVSDGWDRWGNEPEGPQTALTALSA